MRDAALDYARRGYPVVPLHTVSDGVCSCPAGADCQSPGKHPRTKHGADDGSSFVVKVNQWWEQWPDANIGVIVGEKSGLVVLDVDDITAAKGSGLQPPPAPTYQTGRGLHAWFAYPNSGARLSTRKLPYGDLKASGFVVVPPSVHASGKRYEWQPGRGLDDLPPPPLPEQFLDGPSSEPSESISREISGVIREGARNDTLTSLAGSMRSRGLSAAVIGEALLAVNKRQCNPPLDEAEVLRIAQSSGTWEPGEPEEFDRSAMLEQLGVLRHEALVTGELAPVEWLVAGLLPTGGLCLLCGDSGVGKSWLSYALGQAVASGTPWLDRFEVRQGAVTILDAEASVALARRRVTRLWHSLEASYEVTPDLPLTLRLFSFPIDRTSTARLKQIVTTEELKLLVLDPFVNYCEDDENDSRSMAKVLGLLRDLARETGCTVLLVHHSRKYSKMTSSEAGQQIRGSTAIRASMDSILFVRKLSGGKMLVEHDKCRDSEPQPNFAVELTDCSSDSTSVRFISETGASESDRSEVCEAVIERVLAATDWAPRQTLIAEAKLEGVGERTAETVLTRMVETGRAIKERRSRMTFYRLIYPEVEA